MVKTPAIGLYGFLFLVSLSVSDVSAQSVQSDPVDSALSQGGFPWYDDANHRAKPIKVRADPTVSQASGSSKSSGGWGWLRWMGDLVSVSLFCVALGVLIGLMVWFWRIYEPIDSAEDSKAGDGRGEPTRVESLPAGMRREFESGDPWEEALRRRQRGDLSGAVVCLFAHQLLTLSRLGLVRLAPGRTGRQLLRAVADPEFRSLANPTLRLFEAVYYGHRTPTLAEFDHLWTSAEAFERRVAGGVAA